MLILFPIFILLFVPVVMLGLSMFRREFKAYWLTALGAGFAAWCLIWVLRIRLPEDVVLMTWDLGEVFTAPIILLVDAYSWPFAMALVSLLMAVLLITVTRALEDPWINWASDLAITGLGLLAVFSGNLLTMVMAWTVVDVLELLILYNRTTGRNIHNGVVRFFTTSVLGTFLALGAGLAADILTIRFDRWQPEYVGLLFLAVGFRIGILPLQTTYMPERHQQRGLGTILRLVPATTSVVLLTRLAQTPISQPLGSIMLGFVGVGAVYGGIAWMRARDPLRGRVYWILTVSGLAFGAGLVNQVDGVVVWGTSLVYAGGFVFLVNRSNQGLMPAMILAVFGISMLPLSPSISAAGVYVWPFNLLVILLLAAQVGVFGGYMRQILRKKDQIMSEERSITMIHTLGVYMLPVMHFTAGSIFSPRVGRVDNWYWGVGGFMLALGSAVVLYRRGVKLPGTLINPLEGFFSFNWVFVVVEWLFEQVQRGLLVVSDLLEGQGGMLWAILIVAMLVSLVVQLGGAG